ncbi:MAG: sodium-translocating pyrophosphatase [Acidimicrobiaceae bacterium]|nr:sodium-translocating pyrophosphatase [Acidimicrobiaceae bacterium]MYA73162.1 sodium-translocating pyrophosphatase [Acidimicrobiaceae bacterium]MYD05781.1 sodium-translocating pyrophosphatase [Acidimicrobiaceae bacterium]MYG56336.1 sodium-translocating pyrophosphatase [Acidimicrobiaceae bacterium]MYI59246.1 sodium-translocating pyrophosphatase [Acidimicrobiaceae bacterium]
MSAVPYLAMISAVGGLLLAVFYYKSVESAPPGNERMVFLMKEIQKGARAFLKQEYTWVSVFVLAMIILLAIVIDPLASVSYLIGAVLSATAGYAGMTVATMANARTTEAARKGPSVALPVAFRGGAVMGFAVAGLALLGLMFTYLLFVEWLEIDKAFEVVTAYGLGASSIALFSRVGGGIFTKAADVGADLVGKVEAGIPEDDPRNPASIADSVGDNVGDVAGMGADLFESYVGSIIAPVALTAFSVAGGLAAADAGLDENISRLMFPMAIAFVGMVASIIGSFLVKGGDSTDSKALSRALHRGTNVAMGLTVVATVGVAYWMFGGDRYDAPYGLAISVIGGLLVGWALGKTAEYYTSDHYNPVKRIAAQSETGPATTVLSGISAGMVSVASSVLLVLLGVGVAYWGGEQTLGDGGGIYGIAVAAIGMLATTGVVVSVDAYGPIADNAGGIAEMAELDPSVREVTDALDSLGNTTAAIAKGFAVGSAALTALALFKSFEFAVVQEGGALSLNVGEVDVFIGLFLGAGLPFLFAALTIDAVGRAAATMIEEVRRQFREIPGLREGREGVSPDSARCVQISTDASLKQMVVPGALAVVVPLIAGFIDVDMLGGLLAGALVTGFALAIFMANAGGAWDNAKKYIEAGAHGGKGGDPHKAAVVGDTIGDPFKDTSGPAMNILLKVMTIVSLVFASAFV